MGLYSDLQLNNGQYIPQYAGAPLKELQETADVLSTRHYGNLANASQLEILANQLKSELLPGAKSHVDKHIGALGEAIDEMAKSGGENSTARIMALANALKGDQGILNAGLRAKEYRKQTELIDTLTAQGHTPVYDKARRAALENATVDDAVYNSPYSAEVQPYKDPTKDWEQLLEKIKPDKWLKQNLTPEEMNSVGALMQAVKDGSMDMPLFFKSVQASGVSKQKVDALKNNLMSSYRNMSSYEQQKNKSLGEGFGKSDQQIEDELMKYSMLYVYNQDDTHFQPISRTGLGKSGAGKDAVLNPPPTLAPAQIVESLFDYNENGVNKQFLKDAGASPGFSVGPGVPVGTGKATITPSEVKYDPQYVKDYKTMAQIVGKDGNVKPESQEAKQLANQYRTLVEKRASNPWVFPTTQDNIIDAEKDLARQYSLYEYMDPATGKTFTARNANNEITDEFKDLTGGDPSTFKVESIYDAKNTFTNYPGGNEKFVNPMAVVAEVGSGDNKKLKKFIVSQLPMYTSPKAINTNVIYNKVNIRPGQEVEVSPEIKARELHGAQIQDAITKGQLTPEEVMKSTMPIEATIRGEKVYFPSPEAMAQYLVENNVVLKVK